MSEKFIKSRTQHIPKGSKDPGEDGSATVAAVAATAVANSASLLSGPYGPFVVGGVLVIGAILIYFIYKWLTTPDPAPAAQPAPQPAPVQQ